MCLIPILILVTNMSFATSKEDKKMKKESITYNDYMVKYGENDTTAAIVEIFHDKRENAGVGQMSFLPITGALIIVSPPLGIGLSIVSTPLFISGLITHNRHSNKKLNKVLANYMDNGELSKAMKRKVAKQIEAERYLEEEELMNLKLASLKSIRNN